MRCDSDSVVCSRMEFSPFISLRIIAYFTSSIYLSSCVLFVAGSLDVFVMMACRLDDVLCILWNIAFRTQEHPIPSTRDISNMLLNANLEPMYDWLSPREDMLHIIIDRPGG